MEFAELRNPVADDAPTEDFFVNIGKADAGGELSEVRVNFHEALGIQLDCLTEIGLGDFVEDATA